jgi:hypothetical protein
MTRRALVWLGAIVVQAVAAGITSAQSRPSPVSDAKWIVAGDESADLWFHSLATLGITGPGSLPFYDARYARTIADEKVRRGIAPSSLDRNRARLARTIMTDSAFELLHFLPLYLRASSPGDLVRQVRRIARDNDAGRTPRDIERAVRSALSSDSERAILLELADAIDDESRTFRTAYAATRARADTAHRRARALQARWDGFFAPRLADVFQAMGVSHGELLISPGLGAEGRVVNIGNGGLTIAVSTWDGSPLDAPLLAAIREMCFPLLRQLWKIDRTTHAARGAEESSEAAVRCGAQLVDSLVPAGATPYRALFLSTRPGETPAEYHRRFDQRFSVDSATLHAIGREFRGVPVQPPERSP